MNAKAGRTRASKAGREGDRREATPPEIAARAYEIHVSGSGGDEVENWLRAEQELNAELHGEHEPGADREEADLQEHAA